MERGADMSLKKILSLSILCCAAACGETNAYERACVPCHRDLPVSLGEMFKKYLEVFSSEKYVKTGLKYYLRHPDRTASLMSPLFLDTVGVKKPVRIDDKTLDEALDIYWDTYKVIGRLK
jgi:hypothetical protein